MSEQKVINIDTKPALNSIAALEKELADTNAQLKLVDKNSDAFKDLSTKAASLKGQLDTVNQQIDTMSKGSVGILENVAKVGTAVSGGITAATAAMQLFGVENEDVTKGIAKLQQLMAFTQGISSLKDGIEGFSKLSGAVGLSSKSLKGFRGALISTGLGALVVLLGSIIANWEDFTKAIGVSDKQLQTFGDNFKGVINVITSGTKGIATALGKLIKGDFSGALDSLKQGFNVVENFNEGVAKSIAKREEETTRKRKEEYQKQLDNARAAEQERLDIELERNKRSERSDSEKIQREIEIEQKRLNLYKEGTLEYEKQLTKIADLQAKLNQSTTPTTTPKPVKEENAEEDPEITRLKKVAEAYLEVNLTKEQYFAKTEQDLKDALDRQLITEEQYTIASNELAKDRAEYQAEQNDKIVQSAMQLTSIASGTIVDILNGIADQQDQSNEEGFEKAKKLQIAAATIQMLTGIATALAGTFTTKTGIWDIAIAAAQAASIAASGAINIAKIKNTKYNSSSSSTPSVSSSAVNSTVIPPVQYSQAVQGAQTEQKIGNQKVYVLESDITSTINKVNVAESESRW